MIQLAMEKYLKVAERVWLIITILALIFSSVIIYQHGFEAGAVYMIFPAVAFAMYAFRRGYRKKFEHHQNKNS